MLAPTPHKVAPTLDAGPGADDPTSVLQADPGPPARVPNVITVEHLEQGGFFDMPIQVWYLLSSVSPRTTCSSQQAAKQLHVGVTTLKKVCRRGGVPRWPYRKRSSLDNLIEKTARFIKVTDDVSARQKQLALEALEQQRRSLQVGGSGGRRWVCSTVAQENHSQDILPDIKRYRQSIFKINYKLKQKAGDKRAAPDDLSPGVFLGVTESLQV